MAVIKEFREFFLRAVQVNSGPKPDQEAGFPTQYNVTKPDGTTVTGFNRFLKDHFPSESVFMKLFESITFKKNPEDKASIAEQGLVKLATDGEAKSNQTYSDNFVRGVQPHQLPTVETGTVVNTFVDPFGVITDSFPTQGVTVTVDGAVTTRNKYLVSLDTTLKAFLTSMLSTVKTYVDNLYNSLDNRVTTIEDYLLNHTWKRIDGGGNFDDGVAVPGFASASVYDPNLDIDIDNGSGTSFRTNTITGGGVFVRKVTSNEVEIKGVCQVDTGITDATLFVLPSTGNYRPTTMDVLLGSSIVILSGSTGTRLYPTRTPSVYVNTSGQVRVGNIETGLADLDKVTVFFNARFYTS